MTHPEELCQAIVAAIQTDSFTFYYGKRPDQNIEADEIILPAVFLNTPIVVTNTVQGTNLIYNNPQLQLFFAYAGDLDNDAAKNLANKKKAFEAAREFILRLRNSDEIWNINKFNTTDVDNVFDRGLYGCLLEVTPQVIDAGSTCVS